MQQVDTISSACICYMAVYFKFALYILGEFTCVMYDKSLLVFPPHHLTTMQPHLHNLSHLSSTITIRHTVQQYMYNYIYR